MQCECCRYDIIMYSEIMSQLIEKEAMAALTHTEIDNSTVFSKALINASKELGLTQKDAGQVIGKDRTALGRGIDPDTKSGELALMLVRIYRSLYVLVGGGSSEMKHWMHTENRHVGGVPAQQIKNVQGLTRVVEYLDAMRGKV